MIYKNRLKELRENKELKIYDISRLLKIDDNSYGKYEREYDIIPLIHLNTICNYFKISIDYALNLNDNKNYKQSKEEINIQQFSTRLKEFRKENKLTQKQLADFLNTPQSVISDYEHEKYLISTLFLYTICKKYKISADYLLGKTDSSKYLK